MGKVIDARGRFKHRAYSYEALSKVPIKARVLAMRGALDNIEADKPLEPQLVCVMHHAKALMELMQTLKEVA